MNKQQKKLFILCFFVFIGLNIISIPITHGILKEASKPYQGVVIVLDAGHGGKDDGARFDGVAESVINLEIVKKLKVELEQLGMKVLLTRKDEKDLASPSAKNRKREDMKKRVETINQEEVDLFISIHMNSFASPKVKGAQIFYDNKDEDSLVFANYIQEEVSKVSESDMSVKNGEYYILHESEKIGILLECGFLSNPSEREKLKKTSYQNKMARSIKQGVMKFLQEVYE